ncbi:MAG TPA: metallophosphoesterase, partial [Candidatus Acidoferrales bacterium]|nr:metallophosphoesterase [Candidatus Acidoferrales bacterium]
MRRTRLNFILTVQLILFLAHAVVFATWVSLAGPAPLGSISKLAIAFALLSVSFVGSSLLAFRYYNIFVRTLYTLAGIWLGILNFVFLGSLAAWIVYAGVRIARINWPSRTIVAAIFSIAIVVSLYGTANAFFLRVRRVDISLPNLPAAWCGRTAALVSDTHLGPVRGAGFTKKIVTRLNQLNPDVVFITGDFYDGTAADVLAFATPLSNLRARFGAFFVTGNHEEFSIPQQYVDALSRARVRVLQNENVNVEGLQIVGIPYHQMGRPENFSDALRNTGIDPASASILLIHAPNRLWEAEKAGISLQLSGHTHRGQFFPWTLAVKRIYKQFGYGLHTLGNMQVYTTSGAGTWGPP